MSVTPLVVDRDPRSTVGPSPFTCTQAQGTCATWLYCAGELDLASAPQLERALAAAQAQTLLVVLDPRGLTFVDCGGLHVIIEAAARARNDRGLLLLVASSPALERLIALTGIHGLVTVFDVEVHHSLSVPSSPGRRLRPSVPLAMARASTEPKSELGRLRRLRAVRDNAEATPSSSGVLQPAWPRHPPRRGHANNSAAPN